MSKFKVQMKKSNVKCLNPNLDSSARAPARFRNLMSLTLHCGEFEL